MRKLRLVAGAAWARVARLGTPVETYANTSFKSILCAPDRFSNELPATIT